ncbi:hypothetical protein Q3G72_015681 [Acer saccharum]|nr:hypothetical protein Q3G72_015681 [Acer saccharum]
MTYEEEDDRRRRKKKEERRRKKKKEDDDDRSKPWVSDCEIRVFDCILCGEIVLLAVFLFTESEGCDLNVSG